MKYVLIAIYMARCPDPIPEMRHAYYKEREECQAAAQKYVNQIKVGQGRAFCLLAYK